VSGRLKTGIGPDVPSGQRSHGNLHVLLHRWAPRFLGRGAKRSGLTTSELLNFTDS